MTSDGMLSCYTPFLLAIVNKRRHAAEATAVETSDERTIQQASATTMTTETEMNPKVTPMEGVVEGKSGSDNYCCRESPGVNAIESGSGKEQREGESVGSRHGCVYIQGGGGDGYACVCRNVFLILLYLELL